VYFLSLSSQILGYYLNQTTTASFQIPFSSKTQMVMAVDVSIKPGHLLPHELVQLPLVKIPKHDSMKDLFKYMKFLLIARFVVLTTLTIKIIVLRDVTPCSLVILYKCYACIFRVK
jgi:hypothetical protein